MQDEIIMKPLKIHLSTFQNYIIYINIAVKFRNDKMYKNKDDNIDCEGLEDATITT